MNEKIFERKDVYVYFVDGKPYINLSNRCTNNCVFCIRHNREGMEGATLWLNREPTAQEVIAQLPQDIEKYPETTVCGFGRAYVQSWTRFWAREGFLGREECACVSTPTDTGMP